MINIKSISVLLALCWAVQAHSQELHFLQPADTFHPKRFWITAGTGTAIYSAASIGLYEVWYKGYPRSPFQLFNDWGEWRHMDKAGHFFTTHMECALAFKGARWTGMAHNKAMWTAFGVGMLLQSTVEVMDGFSAEWGFSLPDMAFNTLGAGLFLSQQAAWKEQRIVMKASYTHPSYPTDPVLSVDGSRSSSLIRRTDNLYGVSFAERFLKGYNGLTIWASVNPAAFMHQKPAGWPAWLNIAAGFGVENIYGGFENQWEEEGVLFRLDEAQYPRYTQFYLSPDIDFTRIKTRSPWLKTLFTVINWIKIPAPALEVNTLGQWKFHPLMW